MVQKKKCWLLLCMVVCLSSCDSDHGEKIASFEQQQSHVIPIDEAISHLADFMEDVNYPSRATKSLSIENVEVVTNDISKSLTRSVSNMSPSVDTLLYLINFDDNNGFAVLAADDRISEVVLALTERGSISPSDFDFSSLDISAIRQEIPNFNLYNSEDDDYYIGAREEMDIETMSGIIWGFAQGETGGGGGGSGIMNTGWEDYVSVAPMLETAWHQHSPFNDRVHSVLNGPTPAGCVAVALGQIMAYNEYPSISDYFNNTDITWDDIKTVCPKDDRGNSGTYKGQTGAGYLMALVGSLCNMLYTTEWAFATPEAARGCLAYLGYNNVNKKNYYDLTSITEMLDNGKPVFIGALPSWHNTEGHAWVIDGYRKQRRTVNGSYEYRTYLHCNWGWNGNCNGYFLSNMFETSHAESYDYTSGNNMDTSYNFWFRILTYNLPNS